MTKTKLSFIAAIAAGALIWLISYFMGEKEAWDNFGYYISALLIVSFVLGFRNKEKFWLWPFGLWIGQSAYVIIAMILEPGSANLWPLAMIALLFYTLPISIIGSALGNFAGKYFLKEKMAKGIQ